MFAFLGLLVPSVVYALVFVGFGLTISAATTETRAVVRIVGVFAIFRGVWTGLQWGGLQLATAPGEYSSQPYDAWYHLFERLNPINAYVKLTTEAINPSIRNGLISMSDASIGHVSLTSGFAAFTILLWLGIARGLATPDSETPTGRRAGIH